MDFISAVLSRADGECNLRAAGELLFVLTRALVYLGVIGGSGGGI